MGLLREVPSEKAAPAPAGGGWVVHCRRAPYDVYVGRPSKWGNPFSHRPRSMADVQVASAEEAVSRYREWIAGQAHLLADLGELRGKVLGCWCKSPSHPDAPCHGDVLAELAGG